MNDAISLPKKSNIFLKMDVEGAAVDALHGAGEILTNHKVKASVCTYHTKDEYWKVKAIFQKYEYKVSASDGYMVFIWDNDILETADFRKGMIYAENY